MMKSKFWLRLCIFLFLVIHFFFHGLKKRTKTKQPQRILIVHSLLFGDAIMLIPLFKALRQRFAHAEIVLALPAFLQEIFKHNPYQIQCIALDARDVRSFWALKSWAPFDWAILPAENRYSLLCRALNVQWIIGFEKDVPSWKNALVDETIPYPLTPEPFSDLVLRLAPADSPEVFFLPNEWPQTKNSIVLPPKPYVVLHPGASTPLKFWANTHWQNVAQSLSQKGFHIVLTGTKQELPLIQAIDCKQKYINLGAQCSLLQLKEILENASLLISPDTGIAHLAKLTQTPSITLFGPGSAFIYGRGKFWKNHSSILLSADMPCRNGRLLFNRQHVTWVKSCSLSFNKCPTPHACMDKITEKMVLDAIDSLFPRSTEKNF